MARVVTAATTSPRCICCTSPKRAEIEDALAGRGSEPLLITWTQVCAVVGGIIGKPITVRSLRRHLQHCHVEEKADEDIAEAQEAERSEQADLRKALLALWPAIFGPDWRTRTASPSKILELHQALHVHQTYDDVDKGRPVRITPDVAQRAIAQAEKSQHDNFQDELLRGLGGAIGVFGQKLIAGSPVLEAGEVIEDADFEEVEERGDRGS